MTGTQKIYMGQNLAEFLLFVLHFLVSFVSKYLSDLVRGLKGNTMQFDCLVFLVNAHLMYENIYK